MDRILKQTYIELLKFEGVDLKVYFEQMFRNERGLLTEMTSERRRKFMEDVRQLPEYNRENIAEQILRLGYQPTDYTARFDQALIKTGVSQIQEVRGFEGAVYALVHTSRQLLDSVKEVFYLAAEFEAKDTMATMGQLAQQLTFAIGVFASVRLAHLN